MWVQMSGQISSKNSSLCCLSAVYAVCRECVWKKQGQWEKTEGEETYHKFTTKQSRIDQDVLPSLCFRSFHGDREEIPMTSQTMPFASSSASLQTAQGCYEEQHFKKIVLQQQHSKDRFPYNQSAIHAYGASAWQTDGRRGINSRPTWSIQPVPCLYNEALKQEKGNKEASQGITILCLL